MKARTLKFLRHIYIYVRPEVNRLSISFIKKEILGAESIYIKYHNIKNGWMYVEKLYYQDTKIKIIINNINLIFNIKNIKTQGKNTKFFC